jgi:hypothetical protein
MNDMTISTRIANMTEKVVYYDPVRLACYKCE